MKIAKVLYRVLVGIGACYVALAFLSIRNDAIAEAKVPVATSRKPSGEQTARPSTQSAKKRTIEIAFITHLDANMPEQDVYIERQPGTSQVYRVTAGDHNMNAPLFATAHEVPHNPFDPSTIGPHPKGAPLNMTLGQWLKHRGTGTYSYENGVGSLSLSFTGLVPNGVYTMWHAFMPATPPEPFTGALEIPLGAADGSESVFTADADGRAEFVHTFRPGLEMSDVWTKAMLAINYHSDGRTYGGSPGEFGLNAHIPLFAMLPERAGIE